MSSKRSRLQSGTQTSKGEQLKAQIGKVRAREEARLIKLAQEAGFFEKRALSKDIRSMFDEFVAASGPKESQLARLKRETNMLKQKQSAQERKDDARRKILLGSFLIAQFEHKPQLLADMQGEILKFLEQHKDARVAQANKDLLKEWLS